jgi:4-amino-4-deoxy-L-arabinose transferase
MKKATVVIFLLFFLCYILPLGVRPMVIPDETRYAEISREILNTGDWTVPRVDALRYFEKPVLGHWLNAASQYLFGQNSFAVRLPSALAAGLSALAIFLFVQRFVEAAPSGLLAAGIFLTCLEVFGIGVFCVLDSVFSLFITTTLVTFCFAWTQKTSRKKYAFLALSGVCCGLAFLTKGFLAFMLPALVIIPFAFWEHKWTKLPALCWLPLTTAFLVALPWSVAIYFREPDFWHYFFWTEHVERFLSAGGGQHPEPFWFFVPVLAAGALPWTSVFPLVVAGLRKMPLKNPFLRFLLCWLVFPFLFFSACRGKLATYILPCYPPVAILTAVGLLKYIAAGKMQDLSRNLRNSAAILFILAAALILIQTVIPGARIYGRSEIRKCVLVVIAIAAYAMLLLRARETENIPKKLALWCLGPVLLMFVSHFAMPDRFAYGKAPTEFLLHNAPRVCPDTMLVSDNYLTPAVCWCYKRTDVFLIDRAGEFTYGLNYADSKQRLLDVDQLKDLITTGPEKGPIVLITSAKRYAEYGPQLPKPVFENSENGFIFAEFARERASITGQQTHSHFVPPTGVLGSELLSRPEAAGNANRHP